MNRKIQPLTESELRAAYEHQIKELLGWAIEHTETANDPYCSGTVHFLWNGALVVGLWGYDEVEYERVLYLSDKSQGWFHVFEADTLWEVHLSHLHDQADNEALLKEGIDKAIDAFLGGQSLIDQCTRRTHKNIARAFRWAIGEIHGKPEHLRPFAECVLELYGNGNVSLDFEPSKDASEEIQREFWLKCRTGGRVFGVSGDTYLGQVNIGGMEGGGANWAEIDELINKATV